MLLSSAHFIRRIFQSAQLAGLLLIVVAASSIAATLPSGFTETSIGGGIGSLTAMAVLKDGRVLVSQQDGYVRVLKNGNTLPTPFVTINVVRDADSGLFGLVADPNFATNGYVYVYYTTSTPTLHYRLSRFTADPTNPDVALAGSEVSIMEMDDLVGTGFHPGGAMRFGPDGKLYLTVGDNDDGKYRNAQNMNTTKGKILRLNPDGSIPTDNPFYASTTGKNRAIWALGLRHPWTMDIQPGTGRIFVCDVGGSKYEEVSEILRGANYGWPSCEGACVPANASYQQPLYYYGHGSTLNQGCSIIGAAFYNPTTNRFPISYFGKFFFSDYCNSWFKTYDPATGQTALFATGTLSVAAIEVAADGYLYYLPRAAYGVYRISYTGQLSPAITEQPVSQTKGLDQGVTFHVSASGDVPLSYQWQRNNANLSGQTTDTYSIASTTASDNGAQFRCIVTNSYGSATSQAAILTVINSRPPSPDITSPADGVRYNGGDTINYAATAIDPEDGQLPASFYTWWADFEHHAEDSSAHHAHQFFAPIGGVTSGSFTIPKTGETDDDVWYRLYLMVTDSVGVSTTVYRDILPNTSTFTLATNPAGLQLTLDGQPVTAPVSTLGVVGMTRSLGLVSPQTVNGTSYVFDSWSDGGAATHDISTPAADTTYTATFRVASPPQITAQPSPAYALVGSSASFSVTAGGDGPISYQWQRNGQNMAGATSSTYVTPPVTAADNNASFACTVANAQGSVSSAGAPLYAMVTLRQYTDPTGLKMLIDGGGSKPGVPVNTPWAFSSVIGSSHTYSAVTPQVVNGVTYDFDSWSTDTGSSRSTDLQDVTPGTNRYYTAVYHIRGGNVGTGTGLLGKYSNNMDFTGTFVRRTDAVIDFNWRNSPPVAGIDQATFSVRWTGAIEAQFSQPYTFYTSSDDGVRVVVNGNILIDDWTNHSEQGRTSSTIWLTAGKKYPIRVDYFNNTGAAAMRLYWSGRSIPKSIIPASQLYPTFP